MKRWGLSKIFQRASSGPATQHGYLRFVAQMSELASDFLCNRKLRSFVQQQKKWQQLEQFIQLIHQGLNTQQTVYTIANEGRRLLEVDRLSVAVGTAKRCRIEAVSGLDSIERRADQVKQLGSLAKTAIRTGQPLWYDGDDTDFPPQIEKQLHRYVDRSHCKMLGIIPLKSKYTETATASPTSSDQPIGALIVEQLKDSQIPPALEQRVELVAAHSETALTNSLNHNRIFLLPLWSMLGQLTSNFQGSKLTRTVMLLAALAAGLGFLTCFPYPFGVNARGSLVAQDQYPVFANIDGVLQEVFVSNNGDTFVQKGDLLARMTNNEVMVQIENLRGQIEEAKEKLRTNQILQSQRQDQLTPADRAMISGEIATAEQTIYSLNNELKLKLDEAELLNITSPATGQVVDWQVRQNLLRRPVSRSQNLMTIVNPETEWQIELEMPERRVGHLLKAMEQNLDSPLKVTFGLVSHPGAEYEGRVLKIDRQLNVHSEEGNTALVKITFDNSAVDRDLLRSGTRVTAKVHCGNRSIGYSMFHELIETIQSKYMLWF